MEHVVGVEVAGLTRQRTTTSPTTVSGAPLRQAFVAALACFTLAALTGSLLRFGALHGFPFGLQFVNVRHAHTHLMYFGWVTPALFALIGALVVQRSRLPLPRAYHLTIAVALVAGVLSYPPFLLSGYQLTAIGDARLPLSMISASLVVLAWYAWSAAYLAVSWRLPRDAALLSVDAALLTMLTASTGAWGLAIVGFAPIASVTLMNDLVTFFLDLFANGWFTLALVGLLLATLPPPARVDRRIALPALLATLTGTLVAAFADLVGGADTLATTARLLAAVGLATLAFLLMRTALGNRRRALTLVATLLLVKAILDGALAFAAVAHWSDALLLQVLLLHAFLLGFVSLALVVLAVITWRPAAAWLAWVVVAAVAVMLASLVPLTWVWPAAWRGAWALQGAAWASLAPTAAVVVLAVALARSPAPPRSGSTEA